MESESSEPLVIRESAETTGGAYVRFELTLYPRVSSSEPDFDLSHSRWPIDFPTEHVHLYQEERWQVLSGKLAVAFGGDEKILNVGDDVTLPAGVPHRIWNPSAKPSRVILEFHPARKAQSLTETLFVLAQIGKMNENGRLNVLQFAVIQAAHPDHIYLTVMPVYVQKFLITLLAPIGRRLGYRPVYSLDSLNSSP